MVTWLSVRSDAARRLVRSDPTLLLHRGEFLPTAMRSQRFTESEVRQAARSQGVVDLSAHAVVLESDGSLSVLPAPAGGMPLFDYARNYARGGPEAAPIQPPAANA